MTIDLYTLDDGTDALLSSFDATIVDRGQHRISTRPISRIGVSAWRVSGDSKLGDAHAFYTVTHDGNFWRCPCAKSKGRKICSHITATIIFKHGNPDAPYTTDEPLDTTSRPAIVHELDDISQFVKIPLPTDVIFGRPPIPSQFSMIRPHQWDAVEQILEEFKTKDLVFVDAPTGSGKTLIGELARRLHCSPVQKTAYVCSSIQLQAQFTSDFHYAREIKGRSNYIPQSGPDGVTCADCTFAPPDSECFWCPEVDFCSYRVAKSQAAGAPLAVLNTSYFLHAANYAGDFCDRELVIVDECDVLEKELMGFIEVTIGDRMMRDLDLGMPERVTYPEDWKVWLDATVIPKIGAAFRKIPAATTELSALRRRRNMKQLLDKLAMVSAGLLDGNWVFDDYQSGKATFRPIRVDGFGAEHLWPHGKKWLLMSATIVSPDTLAESLGWEKDYGVVTVPHTFPVENRRVNVVPVASMTNAKKETEWPKMANALANLAEMHPDDRILVHTVSYALTNFLAEFLRSGLSTRRIFTYSKATDRDRILAQFKKTKGGILLAPSMDRGVDLPEDDCRVVVVAKVPFASLGNKQVKARLYSKGGQSWYTVDAIRSLVQMAGRGVRSDTDTCVTYVLDGQFVSQLWGKSRSYLPAWFKDALVWDHPKREIVSPR